MDVEGFVLVGGASSRMGQDKASLRFRGATFAAHAAAVLREVVDRVVVVGGSVDRWPGVPDVDSGETRAALRGLHSALEHARADWAAVLACDLPFVTAELFRRLIAVGVGNANCDAIVPRQPDGRLQPLAAVYRRESCRRAVLRNLELGEMSLRKFLLDVETVELAPNASADIDPDGRLFLNVNTPEDYRMLQSSFDDAAKHRNE